MDIKCLKINKQIKTVEKRGLCSDLLEWTTVGSETGTKCGMEIELYHICCC